MALSSSIVSFPEPKRGFAAASKAWLDMWTDSRVTHGEARLAMRLYLYIDGKHFQETGQLLSYPGWDLLQEKTTLHRSNVARGLAKLEHFGAIKIIHGGFDPKTGRRRPNQYLLIPPDQNKNKTHQVSPTIPGPGRAHATWKPGTRSQNQVAQPGRARSTINGEVVNGESINIEDPNLTLKGSEERSLAREEGTQVYPSTNPFTSASPDGGRQPGNGGPRGGYVGFASPLMARLEAYEARTGKSFPRDRRGGWLLTPDQLAVVEGVADDR